MAKRRKRSKKQIEEARQRAEEKKAQGDADIAGAIDRIADLTDEARADEAFREWLTWKSRFHKYSWGNSLWLLVQAKRREVKASRFAGFRVWQKLGRQVRKGEKGFMVFAPVRRKVTDEDTGEESYRLRGFKVETTFDISQTSPICEACEGDWKARKDCGRCEGSGLDPEDNTPSHPEYRAKGEDTGGIGDALVTFAESMGIAVEFSDDLGGASGVSMGGRIKVLSSLTPAERVGTLAHELAHELLHWKDGKLDREHTLSTKELEAEGTAFVVLSHFDFDASGSRFYIAGWDGDGAAVRDSMKAIAGAAERIIEGAKAALSERVEMAEAA